MEIVKIAILLILKLILIGLSRDEAIGIVSNKHGISKEILKHWLDK